VSTISSENIISILRSEIENYEVESREHEVGSVIWVGDGIATIYGIEHAIYGEIVIFENGVKICTVLSITYLIFQNWTLASSNWN
jgi:F-type H+/Na+-transporting ATPase subunit alpha